MCDTFVALPPATADGCVIFGKNSDRPRGEAQTVVQHPGRRHDAGARVRCTYIEIAQAPVTFAVLLSRPDWTTKLRDLESAEDLVTDSSTELPAAKSTTRVTRKITS